MIFYVNSLPNGHAGMTNGPVIRILKSHKDDRGLREHEREHVKQWLFSLGLHSFLYLFSKRYRLWSEVQCYRAQLKHSPGREELFASFIAERYKLKITQQEALELLK
jgi:hypothetical protein